MEYKQFHNIHQGKNIIVCGLGESCVLAKDVNCIRIGVNDIARLFTPDYTVVVNSAQSFSAERWSHIAKNESNAIFTHINIRKMDSYLPLLNRHLAVQIQLDKYGGTDLDSTKVGFTKNSPYVAVLIAAYMGAKNIGLIGVDWTKNHFFAASGEHILSKDLMSINKEYTALYGALKERGIGFYNLSPMSKLDRPPKIEIEKFLLL